MTIVPSTVFVCPMYFLASRYEMALSSLIHFREDDVADDVADVAVTISDLLMASDVVVIAAVVCVVMGGLDKYPPGPPSE
jgi:hypothetical protein